jgi:hypothetical protein
MFGGDNITIVSVLAGLLAMSVSLNAWVFKRLLMGDIVSRVIHEKLQEALEEERSQKHLLIETLEVTNKVLQSLPGVKEGAAS